MKVIEPMRVYEIAAGQTLTFRQGLAGTDTVREGTTNEEVIEVLVHRLQSLDIAQRCRENSIAITRLEEALHWLQARSARLRYERGAAAAVQGA